MSFPEPDILGVIYHLLPGFITAWIFYALTPHPQKSPFERTIQALIFTTFAQAVVILLAEICLWIGRVGMVWGTWTDNSSFLIQ